MDPKEPKYGTTQMLIDVRDAQLPLKQAPRLLLIMLISRIDIRRGYFAFPSLAQLEADTGCEAKTIQRAARALEEQNLIRREVRPNHSTMYHVNVKLLREMAQARRAEARRDREQPIISPFGLPVDLVQMPARATDEADMGSYQAQIIGQIAKQIRDRFGSHPTYQDPNAGAIIQSAIEKMIKIAGDAGLVLGTFREMDDLFEKVTPNVMAATKLGGYLQTCFPQWLAEYKEAEEPGRTYVSEYTNCRNLPALVSLVATYWPEHVSVREENRADLEHHLSACAELAGSTSRCGELIELMHLYFADENELVSQSKDIGAYFLAEFPRMLYEYAEQIQAEVKP